MENQQHTTQLHIQAQLLHNLTLTTGLGRLASLHGAAGKNPAVLIVRLHQQHLAALITNQRARRQTARRQGGDKSLQLFIAQIGILHGFFPLAVGFLRSALPDATHYTQGTLTQSRGCLLHGRGGILHRAVVALT